MIVTIIIFIVILGVLIFVHEFGHFIAAKRSGLTVHEFGFGFPPRMAGIRRGGTIYSLNWIPIGGFVKIKGETGPETGERDSFVSLPAWRRTLILLAGVGMNVLLAMVLLSFTYAVGAPTVLNEALPNGAIVRDQKIQVVGVLPQSPAADAGLRTGDSIVDVNGVRFTNVEQIQQYNAERKDQKETVTVKRGSEQLTLTITPATLEESGGQAVWGVNLLPIGVVSFPWYEALWLGIRQAVLLFWQIILAFVQLFKNLIVHQQISADIAGPVGIAVLTGQVVDLGILYVFQFAALLSLNLALVNALPFPALDGGRVLFIFFEKIRGRKISAHVESIVHNIGFVLLLLLILVVTIRDVDKLTGGLLRFFSSLIGKAGG